MVSSYLLIHSRLRKAQAVTCTCLLYRKANRLVNSGAFHHGERFANQHLISSIFSPSQLIIALPHNCFFLYEGRRKIFAQSNHPIVCNFYSGEFLPLTNKNKTIGIAQRVRLVKSCWLTFTETIKKLKKSANLIVLS